MSYYLKRKGIKAIKEYCKGKDYVTLKDIDLNEKTPTRGWVVEYFGNWTNLKEELGI